MLSQEFVPIALSAGYDPIKRTFDTIAHYFQAVNLIVSTYKDFPLPPWQIDVRKALEKKTEELLQNKQMLKDPASAGGIKKKDIPGSLLSHRLQLLKPDGVLSVLERLHQSLERIEAFEDTKAVRDEIKAAAKERIYLKDADADSVGSLLRWTYVGKLQYYDADHLCKIYSLAERLGLTDLEDQCLATLSAAASLAIENTTTAGVSLQNLLDGINTPDLGETLPGVVRAVFMLIVRRKRSPTVLRRLVITAIANCADRKLVETSLEIMSLELKNELCLALTDRICELRQAIADQQYISHSDHHPERSVKPDIPSEFDAEMKGEGDSNRKRSCHTEGDSYDVGELIDGGESDCQ